MASRKTSHSMHSTIVQVISRSVVALIHVEGRSCHNGGIRSRSSSRKSLPNGHRGNGHQQDKTYSARIGAPRVHKRHKDPQTRLTSNLP
jgi:hypothetical protein